MAVRHKVNRSLLLGALLLLGECPVSYSAGVTLFGIGNELDSIIVAASFSILICVILVLEHSISYLHDYLEDTHYIDMMIAIENELMIVGSVAFILTIIINSESEALPKEWLLGIEFVDILVPLTVFVYCIHGILLIFLSIQQCATWSKATYQERPDLFASFYETIQNWYGRWRYLPYNPNMHALEFRIFRNIFCEMFNIKLEALAFDAYAAKQWQNFLVHLVEIKFSSWICVVAAFWLRTLVEKTGGDVDACEGLYRGDHRLLGASASSQSTAEYDECIAIDSALSFLYVGIAVLAITFALALHSRWLELRFLRLRGIEHVDEYDVYIESQESSSRSRRGSRGVVSESGLAAYDETELKNAVVNLRRVRAEERARTRRAEKHNIRLGDEEESASFLGRACSAIKMIIWRTQKDASSISHRIISSSFAKEPVGPRAGMLRKNSSIGYVLNSDASDSTPNMDAITEEDESLALPDHVGILARQATVKNINNRLMQNAMHPHGVTSQTFLFVPQRWYFFLVDLMMMAIAVYDSVWLVQILPALLKNSNNSGKIALWSIVTIFPSLLSSFFYALTVRSRVLLGAVTNFDTDVLAEVIEDTESDRDLGVMVRTKILECLNQIEDDLSPQKRMEVLFNEIDVDNSKHLSTNEFFELINLMNVSFSKKKWRQIFRTIDKDGNDTISFHEMLLFLWPDDPLGLHKEQQRLRTVRKLASQTKELSLTRRSKKDVSYIVASASKAAIHPSSPSSGSVEIEDFDEKLETEVLYDH